MMGASDGYVVGTTKVIDQGPDNARWNLVIIGDGYRAGELSNYHTHVQNFITQFRNTPPFNELFRGINVYRIDVVSTDSGADDPGCAGGQPVTANTYFDATFCTVFAGSPLDRLLSVNTALALSVASEQVPLRHQVLCIVNSTKYGGSGGTIATCSVNVQSHEIAIHEMGHSAFGLADEYGGNGVGTPVGEPAQPNVTRDTNRTTNKWRALIAPTTPMPSQCDASCTSSTCVPPATPPAPGAVGTYEGAIYSNCNTYRPLPSCYMRDYRPFCPVCSGVIRAVLQPFQPAELLSSTQVSYQASGLAYSRASKTFNGTLTITNISSSEIVGPFQIVLDSLTAGVMLTNATSTFGEWPFITVQDVGSLVPGQSATVNVQFSNPSNTSINFTPLIYSGSFN